MGKSRVRVRHIGEEQGTGEEEEASGSKTELRFGDFLQWSQESSLPVSRTMVTVCGGDPTVNETVNVTLWRKESLLEGFGADPDCGGGAWSFNGRMRVLVEEEEQRGLSRIRKVKMVMSWRRRSGRFMVVMNNREWV
ncbi:LOW QUALITY PROTEIN: hypothetical protein TorRG33x02_283130 [Trema orientale]|uniref:Uncharacterized protein n=1 Tax=Trema orientale TaxID=63057 RepID=A0A2P5CIZ3_TREOI|nr:LOW QUALITY PROTEIN: hypothetical protein TorRG33x02_283130 [Trema orientale]